MFHKAFGNCYQGFLENMQKNPTMLMAIVHVYAKPSCFICFMQTEFDMVWAKKKYMFCCK